MKKITIILLPVLFPFLLYAQQNDKLCGPVYDKAVSLMRTGNYQLAIQKLNVYKLCCKSEELKKADSLMYLIYKTINRQRNDAIRLDSIAQKKTRVAEKQTKIAVEEGNKAMANYLISEAKTIVTTNPTLALRLAEEAVKIQKEPKTAADADKIYNGNTFYRIFAKNDSITSSSDVNLSPAGKIVILKTSRRTYFYKLNGQLITEITNRDYVYDFFDQDKYLLIVKNIGSSYRIIDNDGKETASGKMKTGPYVFIDWVKISPSSDYMLVQSFGGNYCELMDFSNKTIANIPPVKPFSFFSELKFSATGNYFAVSSTDSLYSVSVYNKSGKRLQLFTDTAKYSTQFTLSPEGQYTAIWKDNIIMVYNLNGDTVLEQHCDARITDITFTGNSKELIVKKFGNIVEIIDLDGDVVREYKGGTGKLSRNLESIIEIKDNIALVKDLNGSVLEELKGHSDKILSAVITPDGKYVYTAATDKTIYRWALRFNFLYAENTDTAFLNRSLNNTRIAYPGQLQLKYITETDTASAVQQKRFAQVQLNTNGYIRYRRVKSKPDFDIEVNGFLQGNKKMLIQKDSIVTLFDAEGRSWKEINTLKQMISIIGFSPGGNRLAAVQDGSITLFDPVNRLATVINTGNENIKQFSFSPDGQLILVKTTGSIRFMHLNGTVYKAINGIDQQMKFVSFSADGKKILVKSRDTFKVLSIEGTRLHEFRVRDSEKNSDSFFSPDGKFVYTLDKEGIKQLDLNGELHLKIICRNPVDFIRFENRGETLVLYAGEETAFFNKPVGLYQFLKSGNVEPLSKEQRLNYEID